LTLPQNIIPTYALYGEFLSGGQLDALHHETIRERSSKHGWDIKLHRHKHLAQVFLFRTKGVFIRVGEIDFQTTHATALFVPPMVTHGFRFPNNIDGDVISFPGGLVHATQSADHLQSARILTAVAPDRFDPATQIIAQLVGSYHMFHPARAELLTHLLQVLFIYLQSGTDAAHTHTPQTTTPDMSKHEQQAHAFCAQIEQSFASSKDITAYAFALDVSPPHLTRISKKVLGATPNELITRRRMVEAERLLKFTRHSIADIAVRAGYPDAPYFNRTFKRRHGITPGAFRRSVTA
jgi:AraC family transcriptional activator of pobA